MHPWGHEYEYKERESAAGQPIDSLLLDTISEDDQVRGRRDRPAGERRRLAVREDN